MTLRSLWGKSPLFSSPHYVQPTKVLFSPKDFFFFFHPSLQERAWRCRNATETTSGRAETRLRKEAMDLSRVDWPPHVSMRRRINAEISPANLLIVPCLHDIPVNLSVHAFIDMERIPKIRRTIFRSKSTVCRMNLVLPRASTFWHTRVRQT